MEREGCCLPNSGMSEFNPEPSYSRPAMTCKMTYEACGVTRREPAQGGWRGPALLKVRELFRLLERKFWLLGGRDLSLHTDTQNTHTHTLGCRCVRRKKGIPFHSTEPLSHGNRSPPGVPVSPPVPAHPARLAHTDIPALTSQ